MVRKRSSTAQEAESYVLDCFGAAWWRRGMKDRSKKRLATPVFVASARAGAAQR
jgi:hypothetical protein